MLRFKFKFYSCKNDLPYVCVSCNGIIIAKVYEDFSKTDIKEIFINQKLETRYKDKIRQLFDGEITEFMI